MPERRLTERDEASREPAVELSVEFSRVLIKHFERRGVSQVSVRDTVIAMGSLLAGYIGAIEDEKGQEEMIQFLVMNIRATKGLAS